MSVYVDLPVVVAILGTAGHTPINDHKVGGIQGRMPCSLGYTVLVRIGTRTWFPAGFIAVR